MTAALVVLLLAVGAVMAHAQSDDPIFRDTNGVCHTTQFGPPQVIHCGVMPGY